MPRFPSRLMSSGQPYPSSIMPYAAQNPNLYTQPSSQYIPRGASFGGAKLGPGDANAGPRMFVGKLNKETSEQDIKVSLNPDTHLSRRDFVVMFWRHASNRKRIYVSACTC